MASHPDSVLILKGGTDADMAPPIDYLRMVLAPLLRALLHIQLDIELQRRGFFPRGGGCIRARVVPLPPTATLPPLNLTKRGKVTCVTISCFTAGKVQADVADRMAKAASKDVRAAFPGDFPISRQDSVRDESAVGDGCGITLVAETETGCILGATAKGVRGMAAETVGSLAAADMVAALRCGACVDEWMQDQLIIFMALAGGTSRMLCGEPTLHTRTAILVAEQLLGVKFKLTAGLASEVGQPAWLLECEGAGISPGSPRFDPSADGAASNS